MHVYSDTLCDAPPSTTLILWSIFDTCTRCYQTLLLYSLFSRSDTSGYTLYEIYGLTILSYIAQFNSHMFAVADTLPLNQFTAN